MELIKRRGTLVVVSAPSGAGKSTLCHEVRSLIPDLYYSVSYTTRAPRPGEIRGTDFHFITEAEFIAMRNRDEFAEWAEVHGHLYGTPARALEGALGRGLDVLLDIDTQGARQLRQRYPEAVSVFIMAPSVAEPAPTRSADAPAREMAPPPADALKSAPEPPAVRPAVEAIPSSPIAAGTRSDNPLPPARSMTRLICRSRSTIDTTLPTGSGWWAMNVPS